MAHDDDFKIYTSTITQTAKFKSTKFNFDLNDIQQTSILETGMHQVLFKDYLCKFNLVSFRFAEGVKQLGKLNKKPPVAQKVQAS